MPRKTKEQTEKEKLEKKKATTKKPATTAKKVAAKKATTKKATATKTASTKKATSTKKAATTTKTTTAAKKATTTKKATTATKKAATTKKAPVKKATSSVKSTKSTATKKTTTSKKASTTKKTTTKKATTKRTNKKAVAKVQAIPVVEYYDLPYRYNQTLVKLLAQTPTTLFVYWDISDEDRENYKKNYGENFFEETKPVLIVKNTTKNYSFEVEINDFANSWYLHVNDSKCDYSIELGRRPVSSNVKDKIKTDYIYVTTSNAIESPNDRILFNINEQKVYYRNVKNNVSSTRKVPFINSMGKIYNIYELYNTLYKDEDFINSMPTSSWFK
ncbi:MAG: DUF4912 domain-containing protein [Clostridia bacterium]|nr:DUF4912 domain-containing protein [Clostridia bacterium]